MYKLHTQMLQGEVVGQESHKALSFRSPKALAPASRGLLCERGPLLHTCADVWGWDAMADTVVFSLQAPGPCGTS